MIPNQRPVKCVKEMARVGPIEFHAEAPTPANDPAGMEALNYSA